MFYIINRFIQEVVSAVNGNIKFGENITGEERLFDFVFVSTLDSFPQTFKWLLAERPIALTVVEATENGAPVMVHVAWQYTPEGNVQITDAVKFDSTPQIANLATNTRYRIRVRVTP